MNMNDGMNKMDGMNKVYNGMDKIKLIRCKGRVKMK